MKFGTLSLSRLAPKHRYHHAATWLSGIRTVFLLVLTLHFAGCATAPTGESRQDRSTRAGQLLRQARHEPSHRAVGLYLSAAENALALATSRTASPETRAAGTRVYNTAIAECAVALQKQHFLRGSGASLTVRGADKTYTVRVVSTGKPALKNPAKFNRLIESATISRKHLDSDIRRDGLGGTLVGVTGDFITKTRNQPLKGFAEPVTAIVAFGKSPRAGATPVELFFFDPQTREKIEIDGSTFPLAGDFTAPLAYFPKVSTLMGIVAMLRSDRAVGRSGIYFCEPYNPRKIPVLFVHGLMSSPQTWVNFINELSREPEFRERYQPWLFFYPTGAPIAGTALRLRRAMADLAAHYPLKPNMIMVGHSMGGILTRMQVTSSEQIVWDTVFGSKAKTVDALFPDGSLLKQALIFRANPYVTRAIFISTPHLGSDLASMRISSMIASLIRLPANVISQFDPQMKAAIHDISPSLHSMPTSIIGLSPKSPLLHGVSKLPIKIPYHSIIGNRGRDNEPLAESSDGVVPYWSSHLAGAQSETIVPTGHDAYNCSESVVEVLEILKK